MSAGLADKAWALVGWEKGLTEMASRITQEAGIAFTDSHDLFISDSWS